MRRMILALAIGLAAASPAAAQQSFSFHLGETMGQQQTGTLSLGVFGEERAVVGEMLAEAGRCADEIGLADVAARVARLHAKLRKHAEPDAAFRNEGDVWVVRYAGREVRVRDGKGPRYLATLLAAPGREVHVLELGAEAGERPSPFAGDALAVGLPGGTLDQTPDERANCAEWLERWVAVPKRVSASIRSC